MNAHTPTPKLFLNTQSGQFGDICTVEGCYPYAQVQPPGHDEFPQLSPKERNEMRQERGLHIVQCVNTHAALVAALEKALPRVTHDSYCNHNHRVDSQRRCDCGADAIREEMKSALRAAALAQTQPSREH